MLNGRQPMLTEGDITQTYTRYGTDTVYIDTFDKSARIAHIETNKAQLIKLMTMLFDEGYEAKHGK